MSNQELFIGLMSGTSLDAVDAVLLTFNDDTKAFKLDHSLSFPIPEELRSTVLNITKPGWKGSLLEIGRLNHKLGKLFADASNQLVQDSKYKRSNIKAIGSHGQTLWHQPDGEFPFSLQLGDANIIAELTQITTIADFRSRDIAAGGQGAPLVPAFHQYALSSPNKIRTIVNIGGIANVTILPPKQEKLPITGFDTGPGNGILDAWIQKHKKSRYDHDGNWARSGKILPNILDLLTQEPYFSSPIPKSTGKERFNLNWLEKQLKGKLNQLNPKDIQATLVELTAKTITDKIPQKCDELYICGGGVHNKFLLNRIQSLRPNIPISSTLSLGVDPDWMEAIAFAWLAKQTIERKPGNLPTTTGAAGLRILGAIHPA